jgi:hypothetical protein
MKKAKNIHNFDTLEREIYRLKLEAKNIEEKLDRNLDHLQENYFSMTMNSVFGKSRQHDETRGGFFDSFFKNESFNAAINRMTGIIADKAAAGIEILIDKLFHKNK